MVACSFGQRRTGMDGTPSRRRSGHEETPPGGSPGGGRVGACLSACRCSRRARRPLRGPGKRHHLHRPRHRRRVRDRGRARRRPVVHQTVTGQQLDRADHHRRDGHQLHRHRHQPTRAGSRPGPTARCGSPTGGNNSIGRITTTGTVTNYTGPGISEPARDHGRARRGAVVHQLRQQLDRADHHRRDGHQLHRPRHQQPVRDHGRARRGPVVHQPRQQLDRADHHRRDGHQLHRHRHQRARTGSRPGPTGRCGSPTTAGNSIGRITTAGTVTNYTGTGISQPGGDHGRARRGAVVHQLRRQQLDRADHHRRDGHQLHRHRHRQRPDRDHGRARRGLWFTNVNSSSIGRITTNRHAGDRELHTHRRAGGDHGDHHRSQPLRRHQGRLQRHAAGSCPTPPPRSSRRCQRVRPPATSRSQQRPAPRPVRAPSQ